MLLNKRGAALLQVLIVTAILAGMAALILRLSLARTITSRQTRHVVNAQLVIESCMAQVNAVWAAKTPEAYARDLAACQMCDPTADGPNCTAANDANKKYICSSVSLDDDRAYKVEAKMEENEDADIPQPCKITYTVSNVDSTQDNTQGARQTL